MLSIIIEHNHERQLHRHHSGPLVIGRVPDGREPSIKVQDEYVSRRQLRLEEMPGRRVRFCNLGRNEVALPDGRRFDHGEEGETELPTRFHLTHTVIDVDVDAELGALERDHSVYDTVCFAPATTDTSLAGLGETPSAEQLAHWFETLLSIQHSAAGSEAFYDETAQALVDLIGLDRGLVLLRDGDSWRITAGHSRFGESELAYSTSILSRVVTEQRTYYCNPRGTDLRASLARLEAVVGSPIFNEAREVVGMLYGSRDLAPHHAGIGIRPLEAQLVQLLANSVTAGLTRTAMLERLKQVEQLAAVGQALGYILHDLRGPLGNAQQLTEMLRRPEGTTLSREEQLNFIDESLAVSLELLNDSLEFCRGNIQLHPVRGACRELLARHLNMLKLKLEAAQVDLRVDIPDGLVAVVDPPRLGRVLHNLAKNAGEAVAGRPDARVTIAAKPIPNGTEFTVADNGPGLPREVREKLFQPFATHGKRGGTGFGLAIARQLVDAHRGTIDVSTGSGGTTFTIVIPEPADAPAGASPPRTKRVASGAEPPAPSDGPVRVLVAEDGLVNQALIRGLLKEHGHEVTVVADGRQAVDAWQSRPFDIVLMDIEMPEMGGLEATRRIRELERSVGRPTPIVALTAHESPESRAECADAGMDEYLVKPPRADDLADIIRKQCGANRSTDSD